MAKQSPEQKKSPIQVERLGYLRRLAEIGDIFGFDKGQCIDRYYIEKFLSSNSKDIRGRVLEIGDDTYTRQFGGARVTKSDILNKTEGNPNATIISDLTAGANIPGDTFDCVILTQTLQYIYDLKAAIATLHRILKPGGVVLATAPGIAYISRFDLEHWGEFWRLTGLSAKKLFTAAFPAENVQVKTYGNMLATLAFICGVPADGFGQNELNDNHPDFQLLIAVRAIKG